MEDVKICKLVCLKTKSTAHSPSFCLASLNDSSQLVLLSGFVNITDKFSIPFLKKCESNIKVKHISVVNYTSCLKNLWGSKGIAPHILNFCTRANNLQAPTGSRVGKKPFSYNTRRGKRHTLTPIKIEIQWSSSWAVTLHQT